MTEPSALAAALAAFQAEMPTVHKGREAKVATKSGGSYSYTYAGLADVAEAAAPLLAKHGLSFTACPRQTERGYELAGYLLHSGGERLEGALPIAGGTPQEMGSSITYMRRYLLGCLTGLVTDDDDDGQLAQQASRPKRSTPQRELSASAPPAPSPDPDAMTPGQRGKLHALFAEAGITDQQLQREYIAAQLGQEPQSRASLTKRDASRIIDALTSDVDR